MATRPKEAPAHPERKRRVYVSGRAWASGEGYRAEYLALSRQRRAAIRLALRALKDEPRVRDALARASRTAEAAQARANRLHLRLRAAEEARAALEAARESLAAVRTTLHAPLDGGR